MKKILLPALIAFSVMEGFAQDPNVFPPNGNTGIGTTTPSVYSNYTTLSINNSQPGGYGGILDLQRNKVTKGLLMGDDSGLYMWSATGIPLRFWTEGWERMVLTANGRLGLGESVPRAKIEVAPPPGNMPAGLFRLNGGQAWGHVLTVSTDSPVADDARILFSYRNGAKNWALGGGSNTTKFGIWEDGGDGVFGSGFGIERLTVLPGGNVGIGISNPAERLAVNGTIRSKEVKVDMIGWPDYVFRKEYNLTPLAILSNYISKNGHLPEIPTDKEVEKSGLHLGEMNKLLLKKVEELTLYLIEKDNQLKQQEERLHKVEEILLRNKGNQKGRN